MRQGFRKQLTAVRRIQDMALKGDFGNDVSIEIDTRYCDDYLSARVYCFRPKSNTRYDYDIYRATFFDNERNNEKPFDVVMREIHEFYGVTDNSKNS